jgi:hypothetical protein
MAAKKKAAKKAGRKKTAKKAAMKKTSSHAGLVVRLQKSRPSGRLLCFSVSRKWDFASGCFCCFVGGTRCRAPHIRAEPRFSLIACPVGDYYPHGLCLYRLLPRSLHFILRPVCVLIVVRHSSGGTAPTPHICASAACLRIFGAIVARMTQHIEGRNVATLECRAGGGGCCTLTRTETCRSYQFVTRAFCGL